MQATKGKQKLSFFTMPEYEEWKKTASAGWTIKYYKGLGTSDKKEAQEYFAAIDEHRKSFVYEGKPSFRMPCTEYWLHECGKLACSKITSNAEGALLVLRCGSSYIPQLLHHVINN